MARIPGCLMLAAGAAMLLPAIAQADTVRSRHVADRHASYAAYAYPYRGPNVIFAFSPFYGPFGRYEDTFWASRYPGPVQRRYFAGMHACASEHDAEKWKPVFGKDHAPT
jgi:hypothetical protein